MSNYKKNQGFTLIELLVVIAIIGMVSSIIFASLNTARAKTRDAVRLSDMHTLQIALALYMSNNGTYPNPNRLGCGGGVNGCESTGADVTNARSFVEALVSDKDLVSGLKEPTSSLNSDVGNYAYNLYPAGTGGCDANRGAFYVIGIVQTDTYGTAKHPKSPGWSCPGAGGTDWQTGFSWVAGQFAN